MKSALEVDCAGAVGLAAGGGPAFSRVLPCCSSFCLESSYGILRGPIGPLGTGAPCCCDAGEDPRAVSQEKRFAHNQKKKDGTLWKYWYCLQIGRGSHHRVANTVVPVCIAISWSCYITVVGASPVMEWACGVVMPVLGLKRSRFDIPETWRMSVPLWDIFVVVMVDCSLPPKGNTDQGLSFFPYIILIPTLVLVSDRFQSGGIDVLISVRPQLSSCQLVPVLSKTRHGRTNPAPFTSKVAHFAPPPALYCSVLVLLHHSVAPREVVRQTHVLVMTEAITDQSRGKARAVWCWLRW